MIRDYVSPAPLKDVLEEHIEEAAFMYECRCNALTDPELSLTDLGDYERRMRPHLHALTLGGRTSAKLLQDRLILEEDDDPGESFVAANVIPSLDPVKPMQMLIQALAVRPPHLQALIDGLKLADLPGLENRLEDFIRHDDPSVRSAVIEVLGFLGLQSQKNDITSLTNDPHPSVAMTAVYSLVSMGVEPDNDKLYALANEDEPAIVSKAFELLLCTGDRNALNILREKCSQAGADLNRELIQLLSIAGSRDDAELIESIMDAQPEILEQCIYALSLCGNVSSIEFLIGLLAEINDPEIYMAAYQGLRIITGQDFLPEFDEDEASPEDVLSFKNTWEQWWSNSRKNFPPEFKWRRGEKLSPVVLLKDILWSGNPCRKYCGQEMAIRYNCPVIYQHDHHYEKQAQQLQQMQQWASQNDHKFTAGLLYYNAKSLL